jgi:uncharacterized membrane protein YccC
VGQLGWREALFSLKTFGSAMLALFLAFWLDLPQPSWAMLTALIVSQPVAGMVASKSLFRVLGTVIGASMALMLVALFAQAAPFFIGAVALWIGLCTGTAVLLRDRPSAYGAMLSGYTAAIVGLPAALAPETAFDTAVARTLEISLGITVATLISQIVFPTTAGPALLRSVDATLAAASRWGADVLRGSSESDRGLLDRRQLIADVIALDALRVHAAFDTPQLRAAARTVRHLQARLIGLLSLLVSVHDRLAMLRARAPEIGTELEPLLIRAAALLEARSGSAGEAPGEDPATLRAEIRARLPGFDDLVRNPRLFLVRNLLMRLADLIAVWTETAALRDALVDERRPGLAGNAPEIARYRDWALAAVAGAIAVIAVVGTAVFWIVTAWPSGSTAVVFAGVITSLMAGLDDPAAAAANFLRMTALAAVVAAMYVHAVLPPIEGFAELAAVLAAVYVPFGMLLAVPRIGTAVTPFGVNFTALLGLGNGPPLGDFAGYLNNASALLGGIAAGIMAFRLLRPLGVDWTVRRMGRGILRDVVKLARGDPDETRAGFESRMFDRLNALFTRLDPDEPGHRTVLQGGLAALRIGFNLLALRAALPDLPPDAAGATARALETLGAHLAALADGRASPTAWPELDRAVDELLRHRPSQAAGPLPPAFTDAIVSLVAIGSTLTRHATFFASLRLRLLPSTLEVVPP